MLLTGETDAVTSGLTASGIVDEAGGIVDGLLDIGSTIFNWAINNPVYLLGLLLFIIFIVIKIIKSFAH